MKILVYVLFVSTTITCCTSGKSQKKNLKSELVQVEILQDRNDYKRANKILDSLIIVYPDTAELYFRLAHSMTISNPNLFEIMNLLDKCLKRDSSNYKAMYLKSQGLMFMGKFREALAIENFLCDKYPDLLLLKLDRTSTYLFCGDFETAISESNEYLSVCTDLKEKERLYRVRIFSNYFLGNKEAMLFDIEILKSFGLNTNFSTKLINEEMHFKEFAIGRNVVGMPCSLSHLEEMFSSKE